MPYKLTRKVVSDTQKRITLTWFRPCRCGGEFRVFCTVDRPRGYVLVRCRDCNSKERIPKPEARRIPVADIPQWLGKTEGGAS